MHSRRLYKMVLLLLALPLLFAVGIIERRLAESRTAMGITRRPALENAPPVLAFTTVALGGFRGLIANVLWIRASDLQDEGKYFEMVQLADWITKLQPHFSIVWEHQAWNMAYNISIKFQEPHDRWLWVLRGIQLLRDEGLYYNPNEPGIYHGLAWIFQHKIGANLDDQHMYYKALWADDFSKVIGSAHPDFNSLLNPTNAEAGERARILTEEFKMDPALMLEVDQAHGPLEWRLPDAHAIYWASRGLKVARNEELMRLRRVIYQSLQQAFYRGRLIIAGDLFELGPNLDLAGRASAAYEQMMREEPSRKDNIATAHRNFLKNAIYFLYTHNRLAEASKWFQYLIQLYPAALPPGTSLEQYAVSRIQEDFGETSQDRTKANLEGLLQNSLIALALGDDQRALGLRSVAQLVHARYMREIKGQEKRVGLGKLDEMYEQVKAKLLDAETGLRPELQARLRTVLGLPAPPPEPKPGDAPAPAPAPPARG